MSEWISVKEMLPESEQRCLIFAKSTLSGFTLVSMSKWDGRRFSTEGAFTIITMWIERPEQNVRYTEESITIG